MKKPIIAALVLGAVLAVALLIPAGTEEPEAILRGSDPAHFERVGLGPDSISIVDGEVRLTGKPLGYFATKREYRDYDLDFEWRYDPPEGQRPEAGSRANTGLLLHVTGPSKVWPTCVQLQLAQADLGAIFAMGEARLDGVVDPEAQRRAMRPLGQWNRVEVTCQSGAISCVVNGVEVARGEKAMPDHGAIAWQAEGTPVRFRGIRIRPLP